MTCNGALKWSSFQACYFFTPYFSIQMVKSAKCTLYLKAHKKFLGQQNFFIFSVFKSWKGVQYENPITFFAYFWLIFSTFQERGGLATFLLVGVIPVITELPLMSSWLLISNVSGSWCNTCYCSHNFAVVIVTINQHIC